MLGGDASDLEAEAAIETVGAEVEAVADLHAVVEARAGCPARVHRVDAQFAVPPWDLPEVVQRQRLIPLRVQERVAAGGGRFAGNAQAVVAKRRDYELRRDDVVAEFRLPARPRGWVRCRQVVGEEASAVLIRRDGEGVCRAIGWDQLSVQHW